MTAMTLQLVKLRRRRAHYVLQLCKPFFELHVTPKGSVGCDVCTERFVPGVVLDRVQDGIEVDVITGQSWHVPRYIWRCPRHAFTVPHELREMPSDLPGEAREVVDQLGKPGAWGPPATPQDFMKDLRAGIEMIKAQSPSGRRLLTVKHSPTMGLSLHVGDPVVIKPDGTVAKAEPAVVRVPVPGA